MYSLKRIIASLVLLFSLNAVATIPINAGLSGSWYNSETSGQGFFLDVIEANQTVFIGWFTFLPDPQTNEQQWYWLTALGSYENGEAELVLYETSNGLFNVGSAVERTVVGNASISFNSCDSAIFDFQLEPFNSAGQIAITRLTPDVYCAENLNQEPNDPLANNFPPVVSQVVLTQLNDLIGVEFDLDDSESDRSEVSLAVIYNQDSIYEIPVVHLSGHIGYPVLNGENKTIYWDYLNDTGFQALQIDQLKLKVTADDRYVNTIQDIIDSVSEERMIADIQAIEGVRHHSFPNGLAQARNHITAQMEMQNIPITNQSFNHLGSVGINIIGTLQGQDSTDEVYIIDGHYDSVTTTPGADDNASGTAGMLEAMRILSQYNVGKTIKFIAFDKEELGLIGSRYYVNNRNHNDIIKGLINFEMIGYTCTTQVECINFPNADTSIYNIRSSFSDSLSDTFLNIGATHVPELKITAVLDDGDSNFRRSDHAPFWDIGVDALFLTDGANFRTPHYHQVSDKLATLDTAFMTQVVKTAVGTLATLAQVSHSGYAVSDTLEL
jgi:hypothetical protein